MDRDQHRQHVEQQLPGLEDEVLWMDFAFVVSVPTATTERWDTGINYRVLTHANYLAWERRSCVTDQNTHVRYELLPGYLDKAYHEYQQEVWRHIRPFV